ncbi:MAG TPA: hypothetical protein PKY87_07575 [Terricaulis sp.]|nr:hypothetical protein [Terricaulis sp.]
MDFWIWILVLVLIIVGLSVAFGAMINARPRPKSPREDKATALKLSGALQHRKAIQQEIVQRQGRKSNRP